MYNNLEISLMVFMPNITTNHAITYTYRYFLEIFYATYTLGAFLLSFEISHKSKKRHFEIKKKSLHTFYKPLNTRRLKRF